MLELIIVIIELIIVIIVIIELIIVINSDKMNKKKY